jgi:O-antigen/teichoic acid export membrane protein
MSPEDYGAVNIFTSWYMIISIFATLNMWNYVFNNGMIKYGTARSEFASALVGLSTIITLLCFLAYWFFRDFWTPIFEIPQSLMLIMFIELLFMPAFEYWCAGNRFDYNYRPFVAVSLLIAVLVPVISIPVITFSANKGEAAIVVRVLTSSVVYLVPFVLIIRKSRSFFNKEYWKFALGFNLPLVFHFLSMIVLQQSDRIMIGKIAGNEEAGIYSIAYSAGMIMILFHGAIMNSFVPWTYKNIKDQKYKEIAKYANLILVLMGCGIFLFILIIPEFIRIMAPPEYHGAVYAVPPICASVFFMSLFNLFANIEYYYEQTKFVMAASVSGAIVNIILNACFIPRYGYLAAAYTTLACYVLFALGHYLFMKLVCEKKLAGKRIYDEVFILLLSLIVIAFSLFVNLFYKYLFMRYALACVMIIVIILNRKMIIRRLGNVHIKQEES